MNPSNKEIIIARVRALLRKTTENGATEAEALAAVAKARELMDRYQLDIGATAMRDEGVEHTSSEGGRRFRGLDVAFALSKAIALFCEVGIWKQQGRFQYIGNRADVEFAQFLMKSLPDFITRGAKKYVSLDAIADFDTPRSVVERDFTAAAIVRIKERLRAMRQEREAAQQAIPTGRELVLVKDALIKAKFDSLGIRLTRRSFSHDISRDYAAAAGRAHGDAAGFGRPVSGENRGPLRIGRS